MRLLISLIIWVSICCNQLTASVCTATVSGLWTTNSIWSCGHMPTCGDSVVIPSSITVSVSATVSYTCSGGIKINTLGNLWFSNTGRLDLPSGSKVWIQSGGTLIKGGAGGGHNAYITINGNEVWYAGMGSQPGPVYADENTSMQPLPIELLNFTAETFTGLTVKLNWITISETSNNYFVVERSVDGVSFISIDTVKGSGNSTTLKKYETYDKSPNPILNYYRLKQVDFNGNFSYSFLVSAEFIEKGIQVQIAPNPSQGYFIIDVLTDLSAQNGLKLKIYNAIGVLILEENYPYGSKVIKMNVNLSPGCYLISAESDSFKARKTAIVY